VFLPKSGVIDDDQVADRDESQATPVPNHQLGPNSGDKVIEPDSLDSEPCDLARPSVNPTVDLKNDIGYCVDGMKSPHELEQVVQAMSDGQKYYLLRHHSQPSQSYKFPTQYLGGANRSFKLRWIEECGWWLVYSCKIDGAFCICCALFAKDRKTFASMVNAPFRKWHHKSEVITAHANKSSHIAAFRAAADFINSIENPEATIFAMVDKRRAENIAENRKNLIPLEILETFSL